MTRRLTQTQERLERLQHIAALLQLLEQIALRRRAHGVVQITLARLELDLEHHVRARRQLGRHFTLEATQDERLGLLAQLSELLLISLLDRQAVAIAKLRASGEQPAVREVEHAPQLFQAIFQQSTAERDGEIGFQRVRRAR